jgi:hypothetical protein
MSFDAGQERVETSRDEVSRYNPRKEGVAVFKARF